MPKQEISLKSAQKQIRCLLLPSPKTIIMDYPTPNPMQFQQIKFPDVSRQTVYNFKGLTPGWGCIPQFQMPDS
jgi:hypothetical protein